MDLNNTLVKQYDFFRMAPPPKKKYLKQRTVVCVFLFFLCFFIIFFIVLCSLFNTQHTLVAFIFIGCVSQFE